MNESVYLSVKPSSSVQEGLADVMHAIRVTSGVFQAGEGSTANLEGSAKTTCHICCGQRRDHQRGSQECVHWGMGVTMHSLGTLTTQELNQNEVQFIWFGD